MRKPLACKHFDSSLSITYTITILDHLIYSRPTLIDEHSTFLFRQVLHAGGQGRLRSSRCCSCFILRGITRAETGDDSTCDTHHYRLQVIRTPFQFPPEPSRRRRDAAKFGLTTCICICSTLNHSPHIPLATAAARLHALC